MPEQWVNRIVGHGEVSPEELLANPRNFRIHPGAQQEALSGAIADIGVVRSVTVNRRSGFVVDGHLRVELALSQGQRLIPVEYVDLSDEEEAEALATLDPLSAMAGTDKGKLDELLREVKSGDSRVQQMLSDLAAKSGLDYFGGMGGEEPEDVEAEMDRADELREKWQTETGQLWRIGPHRLVIGDATDPAAVERVMEGDVADLVFTDPPYNVDYVGKTKDALKIQNDTLGEEGTRRLIADALHAAPLKAGGSFYVCAPDMFRVAFEMGIRDAGLLFKQCLVWVKHHFVFSRQDYHWRHETILYGWKEGAPHYFVPNRTLDTVWEVDRPSASREHPTAKPVALIERAINNSSLVGQIVYDGFAGSGSTLAACAITGRTGRAIEMDARYSAVILERMTAMGLEEELLD